MPGRSEVPGSSESPSSRFMHSKRTVTGQIKVREARRETWNEKDRTVHYFFLPNAHLVVHKTVSF